MLGAPARHDLVRAAKATAALGRDYVIPDDVRAHRRSLSPDPTVEASMSGRTPEAALRIRRRADAREPAPASPEREAPCVRHCQR
jgi:MoxR-like ATPase